MVKQFWASFLALQARRSRSGTSAGSTIFENTTVGMRFETTRSQAMCVPSLSVTPCTLLSFTSIFATSVLYQMSPPSSRMRLSKARAISWLRILQI